MMRHNPNAAWIYETKWGRFSILPQGNGRWQVWFRDEALGSYHSPESGLDDLVGDHCFSNSIGLDTSRAGLPDSLREWQAGQITRR